jgi:hypothetical protein
MTRHDSSAGCLGQSAPQLRPWHRRNRRQLAVQVLGLTDPLGAKGFRTARPRLEREGAVRRWAAVATGISFTLSLAGIIWQMPRPAESSEASSVPAGVVEPAPGERPVVRGASFAPTAVSTAAHTRTRSSD